MTQATVDAERPQSADSESAAKLTITDRCDACGAQAYVRVEMPYGQFVFCGHHARKHGEKLRPAAVTWHDETERLQVGLKPGQ